MLCTVNLTLCHVRAEICVRVECISLILRGYYNLLEPLLKKTEGKKARLAGRQGKLFHPKKIKKKAAYVTRTLYYCWLAMGTNTWNVFAEFQFIVSDLGSDRQLYIELATYLPS